MGAPYWGGEGMRNTHTHIDTQKYYGIWWTRLSDGEAIASCKLSVFIINNLTERQVIVCN